MESEESSAKIHILIYIHTHILIHVNYRRYKNFDLQHFRYDLIIKYGVLGIQDIQGKQR